MRRKERSITKDTAFYCVDWGTTSFRLWALDQVGEVLAERRNDLGMSKLTPADYETVLEAALAEMQAEDETPVVICGMAGAAQGWREAAYLDLPADLALLPGKAVRVTSAKRDVRILPGLAQRDAAAPDVIRGEETLLLGAYLERRIEGVVCLPGTHSKWTQIEAGRVTHFRTAMTGEVFALLAQRSTLSHFIATAEGDFADAPAFTAAVGQALRAPEQILNLLFSVRATPLLMGAATADDMPARLSGLLIGLEIAGMKELTGQRVTLIARGALARSYARALALADISFQHCDAEAMVRSGLFHAARSIWVDRQRGEAEVP